MLVKTLSGESSRISVGACACESAVITGNIIVFRKNKGDLSAAYLEIYN